MTTGKKTKRTTLHNVVLGEISLVDRGANQGSAVLLFKRDDTEDEDMPKEPTQQELNALTEAVTKAEEALGELTLANEELVAKNDQNATEIARLNGLLAERDATIAKHAGGEPQDDITKALGELPEPIAKMFKAMQTRVDAAEAVIAKQADEKVAGEYITKAAAFDKLPTTAEKLGPLLMRVQKGMTTAADGEELERLLKAAQEAIGTGGGEGGDGKGGKGGKGDRTTVIGKGHVEAGDAEARIASAVVELRKSDTSLTPEEAEAQVLMDQPELYEAYIAERNAR